MNDRQPTRQFAGKENAGNPGRSNGMEWLVPSAAALSLLAYTVIVSPYTKAWLDEVYTYYGLNHGSFGRFWESYRTEVNASPPLYFTFSWVLFKIFPLSMLTIRLYSSLACGAAVFILWALLRRRFGFVASSVAVLATCLTSELLLFHNSDARFYGLYFALIAGAVHNFDRFCADESPSGRWLFLNALVHALAVSCHHVAGVYSFAILLSFVVRDWVFRLWRPKVYLSIIAGWIPVIFYLPMIYSRREATAWMTPPGLTAAFHPFSPGFDIYFVVAAIVLLMVVGLLRRQDDEADVKRFERNLVNRRSLHLLVLACCFILVPYGLLLISWAGITLLVERYMLPTLIGFILLFGFLCESLAGSVFATEPHKPIFAAVEKMVVLMLLAGLCAYPLAMGKGSVRMAKARAADNSAENNLGRALPLAAADHLSYFPYYFQSGENQNIFLVVKDYNELEYNKRFSDRLNLVVVADFLAKHDHFQMLIVDPVGKWLEDEVRRHGDLEIKAEASFGSPLARLLTVSRRGRS